MEQTIDEIVGRVCFFVADWYHLLVDALIPIGIPLLTTIFFGLYIRYDTMRRLDDFEKPYISLSQNQVIRHGLVQGMYNFTIDLCSRNYWKRIAKNIRFNVINLDGNDANRLVSSLSHCNPLYPEQGFTFNLKTESSMDFTRQAPFRLKLEISFIDAINAKPYFAEEFYMVEDGVKLRIPGANVVDF